MRYEIIDSRYQELILNIKKYFIFSSECIWDKRNKINVIDFEKTELTVKSFKVPHVINKIAYTFLRDSKAKRSYLNSIRILEFVPKPIGYVEHKNFGLLSDSYFVSEKYDYDFTIREVLTQKEFTHKEIIFKQFATFTYKLHQKGVQHLDYSPGNILIKKLGDGEYEFKTIDVNRMKFKTLTQEERLENFSKLWATDEDLKTIIKYYATLIDMNEEEAVTYALASSHKHKGKKNLKKKLKGKKVVD